MNYENLIRERITELREKNNISEYRLSLDMGHSPGYIRAITSGKAFPSMGEFLYMCECLGVTPAEFFGEDTQVKPSLRRLADAARELDPEDLLVLTVMAERFKE